MYSAYVNACRDLGVDVVPFLDRMIVFDYVIGNSDRHLGNFGLIRDPDTLKYLRPAPLYDNGASMGYDRLPYDVHADMVLPCKPFRTSWDEQLKLVTDLSWVDETEFSTGVNRCKEYLASFSRFIGEEKLRRVCEFLDARIDAVFRMI